MNYFLTALTNLSGSHNMQWRVDGEYAFENIHWEGCHCPFTEAELNAEIARLQAENPYLESIQSIRADFFDKVFPVWVKRELGLATEEEYQAALNDVKTTYSIP